MRVPVYCWYVMTDPKSQTRTDYSKIAKLYIAASEEDKKPHFELIDQLVDHLRSKKLLLLNTIDLGSGPGTITNYLIKRGLWQVVAVDITPEFCDYIRERYRDSAPMSYVSVIEGDMVEIVRELIQTHKNRIAAVTAGFSIIHIPDKEVDGLLSDIYTILVPEGMFYISTYEGKHKGMEIEPAVISHTTQQKIRERFEVYMNYFTQKELEQRLNKVGFEIIESKLHEPDVLPGEIPVAKLEILAQKPTPQKILIGSSD